MDPADLPSADPEAVVNVVNPQGKGGTTKRKNLDTLLKIGYTVEDPEQTHARILEKKYGDAPIKAAFAGAARGATFGLSDMAATGLGFVKPDELRALEQYNPTASTIGELGGAVAGSFIPGLGIAGDLGHLAEEGAASTRAVQALNEGGKVAKVVGRYAPILARGSAEGALYGAGGGISNAAMSDDPVTAEALVGDIASGAFMGAGVGGLMSVGGEFLSSSAKRMRAAYREAHTPTIADGIIAHGEQAAAGEAAAAEQAIPEHIAQVPEATPPKGVRVVAERPPVPDEIVDDFKTKYNVMTRVSRQNVRQFEGLAAKGLASPELVKAAEELEAARFKTHSMLPLEGNTTGMRSYEASDPLLGGSGERGGSYAKGQGKIAMEWTADNAAIAKAAQNPAFREALLEHQDALDHMQSLLGNKAYPPVVGEHGVFGAPDVAPTPRAAEIPPATQAPKAARKVLDPQKAADLFGVDVKATTKAEQEGATRAMKAFRGEEPSVAEKAVESVDNGHGGGPGETMGHELQRRLAHHASTGVVHSIENAAFQLAGIGGGYSLGALAHHYVHEETGSNVLGYLAGAVAGVPLAMLMSKTIRAPLNRLLMGKGLIARDAAGKATGVLGKLAEGVDGFLKGGKEGSIAKKTANAVLGGTSFAMSQEDGKSVKPKDAFKARADEMGQVLADPMKARKSIHDSLAGVRAVDPMLADQAEDLAFRRLLFLGDKMPKNPGMPTPVGKQQPWQPSDSEKARWARYIETAENPTSVLTSMADGSLTSEQVETLQTLYPTMYSRIRGDLITRAADLQTSLPWKKRLTLSVLFDAPVDSIMSPESVSTLQATFVSQAPQAPANIPQSSSKPPEATAAQRMASQ